jgi:hypothetical protein
VINHHHILLWATEKLVREVLVSACGFSARWPSTGIAEIVRIRVQNVEPLMAWFEKDKSFISDLDLALVSGDDALFARRRSFLRAYPHWQPLGSKPGAIHCVSLLMCVETPLVTLGSGVLGFSLLHHPARFDMDAGTLLVLETSHAHLPLGTWWRGSDLAHARVAPEHGPQIRGIESPSIVDIQSTVAFQQEMQEYDVFGSWFGGLPL